MNKKKELNSGTAPARIYLIGYRCTGKTTVGRILSGQLNRRFLDTDETVRRQAGQTIDNMVKKKGWPAFRSLEKKVLFETGKTRNLIVSTGGGIVLDPENRNFLDRNGFCIWLWADEATTLERLLSDENTRDMRPSLTGKDPAAETGLVLKQRKPLYASTADFTIDTCGMTVEKIVCRIIGRIAHERQQLR